MPMHEVEVLEIKLCQLTNDTLLLIGEVCEVRGRMPTSLLARRQLSMILI